MFFIPLQESKWKDEQTVGGVSVKKAHFTTSKQETRVFPKFFRLYDVLTPDATQSLRTECWKLLKKGFFLPKTSPTTALSSHEPKLMYNRNFPELHIESSEGKVFVSNSGSSVKP